jgi:hypothetical protein
MGVGRFIQLLFGIIMFSKVHNSFVWRSQSLTTHFRRSAASRFSSFRETIHDTPKVSVQASEVVAFSGDLLVVPFYKIDPLGTNYHYVYSNLSTDVKNLVDSIISEGAFTGEVATKQLIRMHGSTSGIKYLSLVGLGPSPHKTVSDLDVTSAKRLGIAVSKIAEEIKAESVGVVVPQGTGNSGVSQFLLGIQSGMYSDNRFKKVPDGGFPVSKWKQLSLLGCTAEVAGSVALNHRLTSMVASGVNFAKDLVGTVSCIM